MPAFFLPAIAYQRRSERSLPLIFVIGCRSRLLPTGPGGLHACPQLRLFACGCEWARRGALASEASSALLLLPELLPEFAALEQRAALLLIVPSVRVELAEFRLELTFGQRLLRAHMTGQVGTTG